MRVFQQAETLETCLGLALWYLWIFEDQTSWTAEVGFGGIQYWRLGDLALQILTEFLAVTESSLLGLGMSGSCQLAVLCR